MSTGFFTHRLRLVDLAMRRLRDSDPTPAETALVLQLGRERLGENLTRDQAAELVRQRAVEALESVLARGGRYPVSVIVMSSIAVAIDAHDGAVTMLMAQRAHDGSMSVEILVSDDTFDLNVRSVRNRRRSD